jgi:heptosyltransferase-2
MKRMLDGKRIRRILILYWGRYGELIVTLPLLDFLKELFPGVALTYLVSTPTFKENGESAGKILENHPCVDRWVESDLSFIRTLVTSPTYDLVIDLVDKKKSGHIFSYISGADIKIWGKFRGLPRTFFWARRLKSGQWGRPHRVFARKRRCRVGMFLEIARFLGVKTGGRAAPKIYLSCGEKIYSRTFLKKNIGANKILVGIHPGTRSWHPSRSWGERSYAETADRLAEEMGARAVLFYGPGEKTRAKKIYHYAKYPVKMVFEKDLRKLLAMISACSLFMTSDGGPLHMASALRVPSIGLFRYKSVSRYWYDSYHRSGILSPVYIKSGGVFQEEEVRRVVKIAKEIISGRKK